MKHKLKVKEEILKVLQNMKKELNLKEVKVGLCGSYIKGTNTRNSDIDVVLSSKNNEIVYGADVLYDIINYLETRYDNEFDVMWLELLLEEDKRLREVAIQNNVDLDFETAYDNINKDVHWIE